MLFIRIFIRILHVYYFYMIIIRILCAKYTHIILYGYFAYSSMQIIHIINYAHILRIKLRKISV